ncbi:unnamed protein product [Somion occarium]|uniref:Uncharacterized protein n=1 Tax=Somion occarium TaxID=3059160 RepID=A0ABP1DMI1_9APHY
MDDSDDYFGDDDLVLDETTLAVLKHEESKFQASQLQTQHVDRPVQPPPKKQKTHHAWSNPQLQRNISLDANEFPEISIQGDGTYGIPRLGGKHAHPAHNVVHPTARNISNPPALSRTSSSSGVNRRPSPAVRRPPGPINIAQRPRTPVPAPQPLQRAPSIPQLTQRLNGTQLSQTTQDKDKRNLRLELELLKARMEEVDQTQAELKRKLQEAEEARLAKEGEVKILRSGIEKTAEQHAAELDKLRAAKEATEAKQVEIQRKLREEMEAMRTQFTFRQHELETGTRKTPWTARTKRIDKFPSSPMPVPSQIRQWSAGSQANVRRNSSPTPRRSRFDLRSGSPEQPSQRARKQSLTQPSKEPPKLPGFQNAFQSTPLKNASKRKQREMSLSDQTSTFDPGAAFSSPPSSPIQPPKSRLPSEVSDSRTDNAIVLPTQAHLEPRNEIDDFFQDRGGESSIDVEMGDVVQEPSVAGAGTSDEAMEIEPPDPTEELKHIVLTHSMPSDEPRQLTFQLLLGSALPPSTSSDCLSRYNSASAELLGTLGSTAKLIDHSTHLRNAAHALITMANILLANASFSPLAALLHLIRVLLYSIPAIAVLFLAIPSSDTENDSPALVMALICGIITRLDPAKDDYPIDTAPPLMSEVLGLLETLCWSAPENLVERLAIIPQKHEILMLLISPLQCPAILRRSIRMLAFLASHAELFRHFLSYPGMSEGSYKRYRNIPQIEQLAEYLKDEEHRGPEWDGLKEDVLSLIAALAIANTEAVSILNQSQKLIPSMILYLSNLSAAFWEEDEDITSSVDRASFVMRLINRITSLLFYMVFTPSPRYSLAQRLHYTPARPFNGLAHMFTITMSRFAFADVPPWVSPEVKIMLEHTNVLEGPELEMAWAAFQPDPESARRHAEENDDEREARLAHPASEEE